MRTTRKNHGAIVMNIYHYIAQCLAPRHNVPVTNVHVFPETDAMIAVVQHPDPAWLNQSNLTFITSTVYRVDYTHDGGEQFAFYEMTVDENAHAVLVVTPPELAEHDEPDVIYNPRSIEHNAATLYINRVVSQHFATLHNVPLGNVRVHHNPDESIVAIVMMTDDSCRVYRYEIGSDDDDATFFDAFDPDLPVVIVPLPEIPTI